MKRNITAAVLREITSNLVDVLLYNFYYVGAAAKSIKFHLDRQIICGCFQFVREVRIRGQTHGVFSVSLLSAERL